MVFARVVFGDGGNKRRDKIEDLVVWYLAALLKGGQIDLDYSYAWVEGVLHGYVNLKGCDSFLLKYHTGYAKKILDELQEMFGQLPVWTVLDDFAPRNAPHWKKASQSVSV